MEKPVFLEQEHIDMFNDSKNNNPGHCRMLIIELLISQYQMTINEAAQIELYLETHPDAVVSNCEACRG